MFKIKKAEDSVNRTIRFPKSLLETMSEIAQHESVSLNSFVIQCCEYAIGHLQETDESADDDTGVS